MHACFICLKVTQSCDCVVCWLQDLLYFCLFALCIHGCMFLIAVVPWVSKRKVSPLQIAEQVVYNIVAAMPVALPTVIVCSNGVCASKLRAKGIHVLTVGKLKLAADVNIVAVDKTGTLTKSEVGCCCADVVG